MITVVIAEDHDQVRNAWSFYLGSFEDISILATCSDGTECIRIVEELRPNIVLMDINMKRMSGIDAASIISRQWPESKIIGLSAHRDHSYVKKMLHAGAKGYVTKSAVAHELVRAIHEVYEGGIYICEEIRTKTNN
ncbi:MAG: hypothetical protein C5B52_17115 [Bacteroidetes bacterium]|nr:MAG: hypothetical protein C5B52_17115 [Bacteroidota bacterium]